MTADSKKLFALYAESVNADGKYCPTCKQVVSTAADTCTKCNGGVVPLPPGNRLVNLIQPDGTSEQVAFGDKYWDSFPGRPPVVAFFRNNSWSHGTGKPGSKIEEIENSSGNAPVNQP